MKVLFLGTGTSQGVPVVGCSCAVCCSTDQRDKRWRSALYIETQGLHLVIDTGPDFRAQCLQFGINKLDAVLYTHQHKDHTAGLDDIRPFNFFQKKHIPLYARAEVLAQLRREYAYIFEPNHYAGWLPQVDLRTINATSFEINKVCITPIEVLHDRLLVLGFRIGDFAYITDASYIAPAEKQKLWGLRYLVLNALRHEPHPAHFTLKQAIALAEELKPKHAYFTHISHLMGLHAVNMSQASDLWSIAHDGLVLSW